MNELEAQQQSCAYREESHLFHVRLLSHFNCVWLFVRLWPARFFGPWDSSGRNTGVSCHALLQGIFPTQGLNLPLLCPTLAGGFFPTSATWKPPVTSLYLC